MTTNKKTNKLAKWIPQRKYIKLLSLRRGWPAQLSTSGWSIPLLVYVSRQKKNNALSNRGISRAWGSHKDTVPRIVAALIKRGLAERDDAGPVRAKEPAGERINWFVMNWPDRHLWQDRYGYLLVVLLAPLKPKQGRRRFKLSPCQIAIYCLLVAKEKDGTIKTSTASIAGLLGVDVGTVRSALASLEECGLVELHPKGKTILSFARQSNKWIGSRSRRNSRRKSRFTTPTRTSPGRHDDEEIHSWVFDPK